MRLGRANRGARASLALFHVVPMVTQSASLWNIAEQHTFASVVSSWQRARHTSSARARPRGDRTCRVTQAPGDLVTLDSGRP